MTSEGGTMGAMSVPIMPRHDTWSAQDLARVPDDGLRYELIDGCLLVTPAPAVLHQQVLRRLVRLLEKGCPPDLELLPAPVDVHLGERTVVQPDLLVAPAADFADSGLFGPPLLAIEIASPSTFLVDRNLKRAAFEVAGTPSFWIVDPSVPSLTVWELRDGRYAEIGHVVGAQTWSGTQPYPVTISPADLLP